MRFASILRNNIYEGVITQFSSDLQNGVILAKSILHCANDRDLLDIKRGTHCSKDIPSSDLKHRFSVSFKASQVASLAERGTTMSKVHLPTDHMILYLPVGLPVLVDAHVSDPVLQNKSNSNDRSQQFPMITSPILVSAVYLHERAMVKTTLSCCPYEDIFSSPYFSLSACKAVLDLLDKWHHLDAHDWARWRKHAYTFIHAKKSPKSETKEISKCISGANRTNSRHIADIDAIPFDE